MRQGRKISSIGKTKNRINNNYCIMTMRISNYIELQSEEDHMNDAYQKELKDWNLQTS